MICESWVPDGILVGFPSRQEQELEPLLVYSHPLSPLSYPVRSMTEPRRGRPRGLVKGVLLTRERLSETPPRVKSVRGYGTQYVTSLRCRYRPFLAPLRRIYCNIRVISPYRTGLCRSSIPFFSSTVQRIAIPTTKKTRTERMPERTLPVRAIRMP